MRGKAFSAVVGENRGDKVYEAIQEDRIGEGEIPNVLSFRVRAGGDEDKVGEV